MISDNGKEFRSRYGKGTKGNGWFSFDQRGVHFIGLVNVMNIAEGGLGIGLALVKGLMDLHEGSVEAHSAGPDMGSEFVVRLPLIPTGARGADPERAALRSVMPP